MLKLSAFTALLGAVAASAHAAPQPAYSKTHAACMAKAKSTLDMVNCNSAELTVRNAALNAAYAQAMQRVDTASAALKAAERAWIAYRDADCGVYEDRNQFGTLGEIEAGTCMIDRTIERTGALQKFAPDPSKPG